jgi:hypothetical protein
MSNQYFMKKRLQAFFLFFLFIITTNTYAYNKLNSKADGWCGSVAPSIEWENHFQKLILAQNKKQLTNGRTTETSYTIPVIVHICYWNSSQNISEAQVQSQIETLNNDFAGIGFNSNNIPLAFAPLKADTKITFCLAKLGSNNEILAEPGIERIDAKGKNWTNPGTKGWTPDYIDGTIKPATIWNPNFYLNVWVVPGIATSTSGVTLGYATFPGLTGLPGMPSDAGDPLNDGFVCRSNYFGNGVGTATNSKGRTATHEIGHWLGLRHIWGDEECGTDYVEDTPTAQKDNGGCPTFPHLTCGNSTSGDMFMNFMDYTNDNCMALFTMGQSERFQATMLNGSFRNNLANSPVCNTIPIKPAANFNSTKNNAPLCTTTQSYNFIDKSFFAPTTWQWTFQGGNPSTSTQQNPSAVLFNTPGFHKVTLIVANAKGSDTIEKQINVQITGTAILPLKENFEGVVFPPFGWDFVNRNGNPAINWEIMNGISAFGIGNQCMRFRNTEYDTKKKKDDIMTPKLDFTGASSATLKFDLSHAPFYGPIVKNGPDVNLWDTLEVLITDNCQTLTQQIYRKGASDLATVLPGQGDEFYPAPNQWRTETVTIPASYLNKKDIQIIFRNYGDFGHTIYIDNVNITAVTSTPTATASFTISDSTVCIGSNLLFTNTSTATAGNPDSVKWTIQGGIPSTSTSVTSVNPTFNTAGTYTISLVAYKLGNASAAYTKTIRVKNKPSIMVNSPNSCSGDLVTLTATGATTYTWSNATSGASINVSPAFTTTYTVTGTKDGCSNTATSTVTVQEKPALPVITQTGDTLHSSTIIVGATYEWYKNGMLVSSSTNPNFKITESGSYTVKVKNGNCSSESVAFAAVYTSIKNATNSIQLLEIYPNPTDGRLQLNMNLTKNVNVQIYLYSPDGRELYSQSIANTRNVSEEINLHDFAKGMYILRLKVEDEIYYHKVVKQ